MVCCDINASMLAEGERRAEKMLPQSSLERIAWQEGDAMDLPFKDGSFDAYTIAFGIRNVVRINEVIKNKMRIAAITHNQTNI